MDYVEAYSIVLNADGEYGELLALEGQDPEAVSRKRLLCEMILVRQLAPWFVGSPEPNISRAIHGYSARIAGRGAEIPTAVQHAGALLAWTYARQGHLTDDTYLLLEHVMNHIAPPGDDPLARDEPWPELDAVCHRWRTEREVPLALDDLSPYEHSAWTEIMRWEYTPGGRPAGEDSGNDTELEADDDTGGRSWASRAVSSALHRSLRALQDTAEVLVRDEALFDTVRSLGYEVETVQELSRVPLPVLDSISHDVLRAGETVAVVEGAGTGLGGIVLAAVDIPALLTINLRSISQIAHTYGFRTDTEQEQAFVLSILGVASSTDRLKRSFMANLNKLAVELATDTPWEKISGRTLSSLMVRVAERVGVRLTERIAAQIIPVVGAAVSGGINYRYTHDNLVAARMMYRKRWLLQRAS